jgi:hypothetical protein
VATDDYEIAEFAVLTMENGAEGCRMEAISRDHRKARLVTGRGVALMT